MKRLIIVALCVTGIALAGNASAQVKKKTVAKKKPAPVAAVKTPPPPFATEAEIEDGKTLISKLDCLACHKVDTKLVGPAYMAVAEKYPQDQATVDLLTQKIIKGGSGVWGPVPMAPHPAITSADANKIIKYILTLKTNNHASL
ncbi:MAG TPA: c-type cytochrome [Mucilaginibacter sp.]